MPQHKLVITKAGEDCRVNDRKLEVIPGDTVGWRGANTVGCVVFDKDEWPFTDTYKKIDVPQSPNPTEYFTVKSRDCTGNETNYYDFDCAQCSVSLAGDLEAFAGGGARIIIK